MERIGVVGLGWRQGGLEALANFTLPSEDRAEFLTRLARDIRAQELVYIATCNRVEIAFVTEEGTGVEEYRRRIYKALVGSDGEPGHAERQLRAWQGEGAAEHILLVAMGLDSPRPGETEILGQVRAALEEAQELGLVKERLEGLFQEAIKLAKRARSETTLGLGRTSLAEIGLDQARARLARRPGRVALLGVSAMTERCGQSLAKEAFPILVVNRSVERAQQLARKLGPSASAMTLDRFRVEPPPVAAVLSATGAKGPVLSGEHLELLRCDPDGSGRPLLVDFATDPDFEPTAVVTLGFDCIAMPEILAIAERSRANRLLQCGEARSLVDEALGRMAGKLGRRSADKAIGALRQVWLDAARQEANEFLGKHMADVDEDQAEAVRQLAEGLARRFAHVPSSGLRNLAQVHGPQLVAEFFENVGPDLAGRLEGALDTTALFANLGEPDSE